MNPTDTHFVYRFILFIVFITSLGMIAMNYYASKKIEQIHYDTEKQLNIEKQKQLQILLNLKEIKPTT